MAKVSIINTPKRNEIKLSKQDGIYNCGDDNAYPQLIERIINGSVSAKTASNMLKKFLIGNGFVQEGLNETIIYKNFMNEVTLYDLLGQVCGNIAKHQGAYIQIQWDANGQISGMQHIPYRDGRLGKKDGIGYSGKIHIYNNWDKSNGQIKKSDIKQIDVFNPIKEVIQKQLETSGWLGQISYLFLDDEYIYPLATIDCVREDADTENQIGMFKNGELRRGFFAKYIMYHTQFESEEDESEFKKGIESGIGGGHETSMMLMPAEFDKDGKFVSETNIHLEKIEQNHNDKIFESFENSVKKNICKAHLGIPNFLIDSSDNSNFAQSGQSFIEGFNFYNTQTKDWRIKIGQWFAKLMKYHKDPMLANANYEIEPLSYETSVPTEKTF